MSELSRQPGPDASETIFVETRWRNGYRHVLEANMARFLAGLAEGRLLGGRCHRCGKVSVPARSRCSFCRQRLESLADVGPTGTIRAVSLIAMPMAGLSEPPGMIACVQPDGAHEAVLVRLQTAEGTGPRDLVGLVGRTCRMKRPETPTGTWDDLSFEIVDG